MADELTTESRTALRELIRTIEEVDARYLGPEGRITTPADVSLGHRALLHLLGAGLDMYFDADPDEPSFRRAHWAGRKFYGDNADCIYFTAVVDPARTYRIRGNVAGAAYTSFAVEASSIDERYPPAGIVSSLYEGQFSVAPDGSYEIIASAEEQPRNWLKLAPGCGGIVSRHYFERDQPVAGDPTLVIPLTIEALDPPALAAPNDGTIARDIRRLSTFIRGLTLAGLARTGPLPPMVSIVPNQFNPPAADWDKPQSYGAADIINMMAPYVLAPDEALVIEGRFPKCRFGSVALWNRFLQTYDYRHHQVSLNRKQTSLEPDGSFRMVIAHQDPGVPNWIDTVGAPTGTIYVRYVLPEEAPVPLVTRVVPVASLRR
jgi:hypothetical protein